MKSIKKCNNPYCKDIFKLGDIFLIVVLVVLIVLTTVYATKLDADTVEIFINGNLKYRYNLSENRTIILLDGKMKVIIFDSKVWVEESNCRDQICVHQSPISREGGMIICLPNQVVIKVAPKDADAITY